MSAACERVIEVEDLILGLLVGEEALALRAHVETCADCKDAAEMFADERALFEQRAEAVPAPPALVLPRGEAPLLERLASPRALLRLLPTSTWGPALVGLAAGVVAVIGGGPFGQRLGDDCSTPAASVTALAGAPAPDDGPLTCKDELPMVEGRAFSAAPPVASTYAVATHESAPLACIANDRALCDEGNASSLAGP